MSIQLALIERPRFLYRCSMEDLAFGNQRVVDRICGFLDASTLTRCRELNSQWKITSEGSEVWKNLCACIWRDKQNHPLEPWVKFNAPEPEEFDENETSRDALEFLHLLLLFSDNHPDNPAMLTYLAFIRLSCTKRCAAPLRHVIREEQISLENELRACTNESIRERLLHQILQNIPSPIGDIRSISEELRESGRLLSWRESYIASILDSTRCSVSHPVCLR